MENKQLLQILSIAERLKSTTRHSWTSQGRHESVAEHSWRLAIFAYFIRDEFPELDMYKLLLMCLFHDMGESFTGDIPTFLKTKQDEKNEQQLINQWLSQLPVTYRDDLFHLFNEMNQQETMEAKVYKALDKLEALIQHNEAPLNTWTKDDYELGMTYGNKETDFSDYLRDLREQIKDDTLQKIQQDKVDISQNIYDRINKMETILNQYRDILDQFIPLIDRLNTAQEDYKKLMAYYSSQQYMIDYDLSNQEDFPKDIFCGVLSEDAVYDLIRDNSDLAVEFLELAIKLFKS